MSKDVVSSNRDLLRYSFEGNLNKVMGLVKKGANVNALVLLTGLGTGIENDQEEGQQGGTSRTMTFQKSSVSTSNLSVFGFGGNKRWSAPWFFGGDQEKKGRKISTSWLVSPNKDSKKKKSNVFNFLSPNNNNNSSKNNNNNSPGSNSSSRSPGHPSQIWTSCTPLVAAASQGQLAVVDFLLERGADVNKCCCCQGSPLFWAAIFNRKDTVRCLLSHSNIQVNLQDIQGYTAFHAAVRQGHRKVVESMLEYSQVHNSRATEAAKAKKLETASSSSSVVVVFDVNLKASGEEEGGFSPLHTAVARGMTEMVQTLVGVEGIKINASTTDGDSALHLAARQDSPNSVAILSLLLQRSDIDLETRNGHRQGPVHVAALNRRLTSMRMLLLTLPHSVPPRNLLVEMRDPGIPGCVEEDARFLEVEIDRMTSACERGKGEHPLDEEYKIDRKFVGQAMILNVSEFNSGTIFEDQPRRGSEVDVERLDKLLSQLGMTVHIPTAKGSKKNKTKFTASEIRACLQGFSRLRSHESSSACFVAVMSHGDTQGRIYGSDGYFVTTEEILAIFTPRECGEALNGKPKIFVFQACRGKDRHEGYTPTARSAPGTRFFTDSVPFEVLPVTSASFWSDFAIAYSSVPNYVSYRTGDDGSVFVKELCKVLRTHAHSLHLADMLNLVSKALDQFETDTREKQTCCIEYRNFWKRLYFSCNQIPNEEEKKTIEDDQVIFSIENADDSEGSETLTN